jgi:c-di-GMP-binding flagellar brake protein YcgR
MEKQKIQEKRKYTRVDLAALVVIKCHIWVKIGKNMKLEFRTHTQDMSEGGINVILEEDLHRKDAVELKLYLTGRLTPVECKGQVVWSKAISPKPVDPHIFSIGIKFIDLNEDDRETIRKLVSCLFKER